MKEQFSSLEKWHSEVFDLQRTHKKKFEETKGLIYNVNIIYTIVYKIHCYNCISFIVKS